MPTSSSAPCAAEQRSRGVGQRAQPVARALEDVVLAQHPERHRRDHEQQHADAADQQRAICRQHARAERSVDDHHEDHRQRDQVEYALGHHRAEQGALARLAAARHQHDLERLARARGQDVVAHVADGRQHVAVAAMRAHAGDGEDPVPALAARDRRHRVQEDRRREPGDRVTAARELRRLLLRRPPDDRRERDQGDEGLDEREASVHGATRGDAVGRQAFLRKGDRPGAGRRAR